MSDYRLIRDFIRDHYKVISAITAAWVLISLLLTNFSIINADCFLSDKHALDLMICLGYVKAKVRAALFFLPTELFRVIDAGLATADFRYNSFVYEFVFPGICRKFYICIGSVFALTFGLLFYIVAKVFRYGLNQCRKNEIITKKVMNLSEFRANLPDIFGNYIELGSLRLSEHILSRPIFIWGENDQLNDCSGNFLQNARNSGKKALVFEDGSRLYDKFFDKDTDTLFNPLKENGISWNLADDLKYGEVVSVIIKKIDTTERETAECYINAIINDNLYIDTNSFLNALCFAPFHKVIDILKKIPCDDRELMKIRYQLSEKLNFLKLLLLKKEEISLIKNDCSVTWISCFGDEHMQKTAELAASLTRGKVMSIVERKNGCRITGSRTIVINSEFSYDKPEGSYLVLPGASDSRRISGLFGDTIVSGLCFFGRRYEDIYSVAAPEHVLRENAYKFFMPHGDFNKMRNILKYD